MLPLVSVIMPVFNSEKFLDEAIQSILNQTYENFEFLIFDDGSTDNSKEIIESYAILDNRVKPLFSNTNKGYVYHLNHGIEMSEGEFIARMDSDDVALPNRFNQQLNFLKKNLNIAIVGGSSIIINESNNNIGVSIAHDNPIYLWWISFFTCPLIHPSVLIRKSIIKDVGVYNINRLPAEDFDLWVRVLQHADICNIKDPLIKYRTHSESISFRKMQLQSEKAEEILKEHWKYFTNLSIESEEIVFFKNFHKGYEDLPANYAIGVIEKLKILLFLAKERNNYKYSISLIERDFFNKYLYLILKIKKDDFVLFLILFIKLLKMFPLMALKKIFSKVNKKVTI